MDAKDANPEDITVRTDLDLVQAQAEDVTQSLDSARSDELARSGELAGAGDLEPTVITGTNRSGSSRVGVPGPVLGGGSPAEVSRVLLGHQLDHFHLETLIGGGGMGAVFRARDTRLDRIVAIKVIPRVGDDPELLRRFRNEAQSAARLDHPNIARVYDVGRFEGWHYIVFEYIEGTNLRDLVDRDGLLSVDDAVYFTRQVAEALEHAHRRGVTHRDIKPSNVLVMPSGQVKLVDMGLARAQQLEMSDDMTASGVTLGTFDYISPEQARDPRDADVRSDIYSLGCTLYFALTGRPPYPSGTVLQKLLSHGASPAPDPRILRSGLSDNLVAILHKMLAKQPNDRYRRPVDLISDLYRLAEREHLPRSLSAGSIAIVPGSRFGQMVEQHLPWAIAAVLLLASTAWLQLISAASSDLTMTEPTPASRLPAGVLGESSLDAPAAIVLPELSETRSGDGSKGAASLAGPNATNSASTSGDAAGANAGNAGASAENAGNGGPVNAIETEKLEPRPLENSDGRTMGEGAIPASVSSGTPSSEGTTGNGKIETRNPVVEPGAGGTNSGEAGVNKTLDGAARDSQALVPNELVATPDTNSAGKITSGKNAGAVPFANDLGKSGLADESSASGVLLQSEEAVSDKLPAGALEATGNAVNRLVDSIRSELASPKDKLGVEEAIVKRPTVVRVIGTLAQGAGTIDQENRLLLNSMEEALEAAKTDLRITTIELGTDRVRSGPLVIPRRGLTLKGLTNGSRLELVSLETASMERPAMIDVGSYSLDVENIEIAWRCPSWAADGGSMFRVHGGNTLRFSKCSLTIENEMSRSNVNAFETMLPAGEVNAPPLVAIKLSDTIVRGEMTMLASERAALIEVRWDNGLLAVSGNMIRVGGASNRGSASMARMRLIMNDVTAVPGAALVTVRLTPGADQPITVDRESNRCVYSLPANAALVEMSGLSDKTQTERFVVLRGRDNYYDSARERTQLIVQGVGTDGTSLRYTVADLLASDRPKWATEESPQGIVVWSKPVPDSVTSHLHTPLDYLQEGVVLPGFRVEQLPKLGTSSGVSLE